MAYIITITPINKREVWWTVALEATPNKSLAQGAVTWDSEQVVQAADEWKTANAPGQEQWTPDLKRQMRSALGETQFLADEAEKDAKQYARLHGDYSRSVTYTPPTV